MADTYDSGSEEEQRYQSILNIHLKGDQQDLSRQQQIEALQKRDRSRWWHLLINVAAILFFGYSFYFDITQLGDTLFYILIGVFGVNVGLIWYQKKQLQELIGYLQSKEGEEANDDEQE